MAEASFRGTIAGCAGRADGASGHEPESVWVVDLGENDESNKAGMLEFIGKHLACGNLKAEAFAGAFADFDHRAKTLAGIDP